MEKKEYLECEKRWIFRLLILSAGFFGGYTLSVRGGVFANAQTANLALFGVYLGSGNWRRAFYYLIPMGAYLLGTIASELLPKPMRRLHLLRWDTVLVLFELVAVTVVGFIPASAPHQISQIIISFLCALRYNTFRQAEGMAMSTVFCTDHMRQFGSSLARWLRGSKSAAAKGEKAKAHGWMLLSFLAGAFLASVMCGFMGVRAIWCTLLPLGIVFADLLRADLTDERELLDVTPHGHQ